MRRRSGWIGAAVLGLAWAAPLAGAAGEPEVSISVLPVRYIHVRGDAENFRAHHWMKDGYVGGVTDLSGHGTLPDGSVLEFDSHALIDDNDLGAEFAWEKDGFGFATFGYEEFRKYYDGTGGSFFQFGTLTDAETDKTLEMDLGKLDAAFGWTPESLPSLTFAYEREFKDGTKSRLSWVDTREGALTSRKLAPSWQEIDEIVDVFTLGSEYEVAGFALKGEQRYERNTTEAVRFERSLSTNATASERKIRRQDQAPVSTLWTTFLNGQRSWWEDKAFFSGGYRFAHVENSETETLIEMNQFGVSTNFSSPHRRIDARGNNRLNAHTWLGTFSVSPLQWLNLTSKLKSEVLKRDSNSRYPSDEDEASAGGSTPDGIISRIDVSKNDVREVRWGESFGVRYTQIPRTALYTELEFEQARNLLREDRTSLDGPDALDGSSANEVFARETVTRVQRGVFTLGGRVAPWPFLDVTAHVRHRRHNNDYDDQRETSPGGTTARSAFVNGQRIDTNEFSSRATLKPCRWFRTSFRYQLRDDDYSTQVETEPIVKTGYLSHTYTYDVTVQPIPQLLATAAFSRQDAGVTTPARYNTTVRIPDFSADVNSWLLSLEALPTDRLTLTGTLHVSAADNFDQFSSSVPYGVDDRQINLTLGATQQFAGDFSVGAEYAYYRYDAAAIAGSGNYRANGFWLEFEKTF